MAAVIAKGWVKGNSAIEEGKAKLARGVDGVCGEVVWETVEVGLDREGEIGTPGTHDVEGDFGIG